MLVLTKLWEEDWALGYNSVNIMIRIAYIFFLLFMSLLTAPIVIGSHVLARYCFIFFKKRPRPSKGSYQVRQILALFCNLVAPILG